jgi:ubiquinone/menaquinone biosynthesis C-methylase UbiE
LFAPKPPTAKAPKPTSSWAPVTQWYEEHLTAPDTFQSTLILPNLLRLVTPQQGERILDLACGEGFFSRALAEAGGVVTGIDIGEDLIESAQKHATPNSRFEIGNAEDLARFPDASFDTVVCVLALQNIERAERALAEAARVLKPNGNSHFVLNHPSFRIPRDTAWGYDDQKGVQFRRLDRYLSDAKCVIDMHPGDPNSPKTYSFHHPLQWYFKHFGKVGLAVDRLEEWTSPKVSDSGPRAEAENVARKEFPLFLYIRARKCTPGTTGSR